MKQNYPTSKNTLCSLILTLSIITALSVKGQIIQTFNYTGSIQTFTVPTCVYSMTIQAKGAQGGYNTASTFTSGAGADMKGVFAVTPGQVLKILVGQQPSATGGNGGGGGSFVTDNSNNPLIIAGGGGGSCGTADTPNKHGQVGTAGGQAGAGAGGVGGIGGTNGNGGALGTNTSWTSGAGGGLLTDGAGPAASTGANSFGKSFLNGGIASVGSAVGGFGGGGSGSANHVGGGGGGYSGGGGGANDGGCGGGGGSFNGGTNQVNIGGSNLGHGVITFSYVPGSPVTAIATPSTVCSGNTTTLSASGVVNYTWLPMNSNASSVTVNPTSTSSYTILGINSTGCTTSMVITVPVNSVVPSLTITNTAFAGGICPNSTVMLTASGANTYTWTGGTVPVTNGVVFAPTTAANYIVTGENACGTSTAATSVSVHPFPAVNPAASSPTLCAGSTLSLTATGSATNYVWSGGSIPITNGVGFVPPASTITYSVIGTSALSCTALATVPVTVYATPAAAPAASPSLICIGASSTLSAVGALTYTWASSSQTVFTPNFTVTPSVPGVSTYTITKSNSTCSDTKTISVTTNSLPTIVAIALPNLVCALQPATLSVAGGQSYTWTAPGTPTYNFNGANPIVYPQASSLYTVAASDGTCINVTTLSLSVNPNPTVSISASSSTVCAGQSVTLSASGGNSYTWTTPSGTSSGTSIAVSPTAATAYTLTGDNSFNCTADANQVILAYQSPTVGITVSKALVCSGGPSTLTASGAISYTWDANAGSATTSVVVVNPTNTVSGPVTYTVTGINSLGCPDTRTVQVNVYVPALAVSGNTSSCVGGQIQLTASGTNASGFSWNTGSGTSGGAVLTTTVAAAGIFTVSANSNSNSVVCPATQTVAIGIYANPNIIAVAHRTTICKNEQVDLEASGGVSYAWSNAMNGATITVSPQSNTTYTVTGTDANNCVGAGTVQVKVSGCVGINELSSSGNSIIVYPNPSDGEVMIRSQGAVTLTLVNELGEHVKTIHLWEANNYKTLVTGLAPGVYFVSGQKDELIFKQKLIVIR